MAKIEEQLQLIQRDANIMLERLQRADLNISDERKILSSLSKARKAISNANALM